MLKAWLRPPAGGQAGGLPLLAPSSAGWKIQQRASSIRESLFMMMMTISLCLHSLCYLNPSLSCLFDPLLLPLCRCLSHIPLTSPLSCSCQLSQEVCVKRPYLWGAVKQRKGEWMWKIAPLISTKFDFSLTWWDVRCETPSPLPHFPLPLCFDLFFLIQSSSLSLSLSGSLLVFSLPPACQSGCLASCPVSLKTNSRSR